MNETASEMGEQTGLQAGLITRVCLCDDLRQNRSARLGALGFNFSELRLGRDPSLREGYLDDSFASREHSLIQRIGPIDFIADLGSKHGTWVNGVRLASRSRAILNSGDRILIGHTVLCYRLVSSSALEQTAARAFGAFVPISPLSIALVEQIERVSGSTLPVLLTGERGAGKEFAARAIHSFGPRASKPFVSRDAGALAPSLIEAELFGAVRGAFTDANARRGALGTADTGTMFLDEIANLPQELQHKLLRVLTTGEIVPVGADTSKKIDIRWIVATNVDVFQTEHLLSDFRDRFAAIKIRVPNLLERFEDLGPFFQYLFGSNTSAVRLTVEACQRLVAYQWPGNFREIESTLLGALALLAPGESIGSSHIPLTIGSAAPPVSGSDPVSAFAETPTLSRKRAEKKQCPPNDQLVSAIEETKGNIAAMAKLLHVEDRSLRRWLAERDLMLIVDKFRNG